MLIVCPSCASEYTIDLEKLGADGRTVRCAICRDTWFVSRSGAPSPNVNFHDVSGMPETSVNEMAMEPPSPCLSKGSGARPALVLLAALAVALTGWASWRLDTGAMHGLGDRWAQTQQVLGRLAAREGGLGFRNVTADMVRQEGRAVLVVTGEIVNGTGREFDVPHLEIVARSEDEKVLTAWTDAPPQPTLGPGEAFRFTMRFPSPPPDARQIRVQFATVGGIAVAVHSPTF
jgi:predicted Zn finger-like uncharacterized protein